MTAVVEVADVEDHGFCQAMGETDDRRGRGAIGGDSMGGGSPSQGHRRDQDRQAGNRAPLRG